MRVGDIELDSNSSGLPVFPAPGPVSRSPRLAPEEATAQLAVVAAKVPHRAWTIASGVGVAVAVAALTGAALAGAPLGWIGLAASIPALLFAGLARLLGRRARRLDEAALERVEQLQLERRRRVVRVLESEPLPVSFEQLQRTLGWDTATLAPVLAGTVADGSIIEDLDPETRDWTYTASPSRLLATDDDALAPLTAAQRADASRSAAATRSQHGAGR